MTKKKITSFRLGDLQEEFDKKCQEEGLTATELIKLALQEYLKNNETISDISCAYKEKFKKDKKAKAVKIIFTESEIRALDTLKGDSINKNYQAIVTGIVRAFFLNTPVFSSEELETLKKANIELSAWGRNFNQLLKLFHSGETFIIVELKELILTNNIINAVEKHLEFTRNMINVAMTRGKFEINKSSKDDYF